MNVDESGRRYHVAIIMIIDDFQHPAVIKNKWILKEYRYDVDLMAGYISLSFRDSFVLFSFQELEVKNADKTLFNTSSPQWMCSYSTDTDNDEEKYWKLEITIQEKAKQLWYQILFFFKRAWCIKQMFGLPILMENQNVATRWFSLKMFSWIIVKFSNKSTLLFNLVHSLILYLVPL